jgi:hypothetical protein
MVEAAEAFAKTPPALGTRRRDDGRRYPLQQYPSRDPPAHRMTKNAIRARSTYASCGAVPIFHAALSRPQWEPLPSAAVAILSRREKR